MAQKRGLSSLLPEAKVKAATTLAVEPSPAPKAAARPKEELIVDEVHHVEQTAETKKMLDDIARQGRQLPNREIRGDQRFDELERKEARLRVDQLDDLDRLTKRIKRNKPAGGERITDNTLVRVAVDLLLANSDVLDGSTEAELRKSVGL